MAWTNLFDLGQCTVEVRLNDGGWLVLYSGVLAKGGSASFDHALREYTVAVSADGAVTLTGADDHSSAIYEVDVVPSYAHDYPARIRDVTFPNLGANVVAGVGQIAPEPFGYGVQVLEFDDVAPATPDPLDLSDLTGERVCVGAGFENGGIG